MERRSFLKSLAALISSAPIMQQVGAAKNPARALDELVPGLDPAKVESAARYCEQPMHCLPDFDGLGIRNMHLKFGREYRNSPPDDSTLEIEALVFDMSKVALFQDAHAERATIELDTPLLRTFGIGRSAWQIDSMLWTARVDSLITIEILMRCVGKLALIEPTGEVELPGVVRRRE